MRNWAPAGFVTCAAFAILAFDYLKQTELVEETLPNVEVSLGLGEYFTSLGLRAQAFLKGDEEEDVAEETDRKAVKYQMLGAVAAGITNTASSEGGEELLYAVAVAAQGATANPDAAPSVSLDAINAVVATANGVPQQSAPMSLEMLASHVNSVASGTKLPEHQQLATALSTLSGQVQDLDPSLDDQMLARIGQMAELALVHDGGEAALIEELASMSQMAPHQVAAMVESYGQLDGIGSAVPGSRDVARSYLSDSLAGGSETGAKSVRCTLVNGSRRCRIVYEDDAVTQ